MPQLTVKELIDLLADLPQDALVETEGCDCTGPCNGAEIMHTGTVPAVLLSRGYN